MSLTKLSLAGNNLIFPARERVWLVTPRLGTGKSLTFFYSVSIVLFSEMLCFGLYSLEKGSLEDFPYNYRANVA
jgi:hypothetical protein